MKNLTKIFALAISGSMVACTSLQPMNELDTSRQRGLKKLSIAYTAGRQLELEPCGCSLAPMGGLTREWNYIEQWRKETEGTPLVLSGGTTFAPMQFKPKQLDLYRRKALVMVEGLNTLGVHVMAPTIEDSQIGIGSLQDLQKEARFRMVTTNLRYNGQPLFSEFVKLNYGDLPLYILGISHASSSEHISKDVLVEPPVASIKRTLKKLPVGQKLVILMSSLSEEENIGLLKEFKEIHIVFGSRGERKTVEAEPYGRLGLYANPMDWGRTVTRLDLEMRVPFDEFYNAQSAADHLYSIWQDEKKVKQLKAKWRRIRTVASRKAVDKQIAVLENRITRYKKIPKKETERSIAYRSSTTLLDQKFAEPTNPMKLLVEAYFEEVRQSALKEETAKTTGTNQ